MIVNNRPAISEFQSKIGLFTNFHESKAIFG
jgi:hypothetical protein